MEHIAYLSLGSNLGDRHNNLSQAIALLGQRVGKVLCRSSFVETAPWGFESSHLFVNACVKISTTMSPFRLLLATQEIERALGRTLKSTDGVYHNRLIDIDILLYDILRVDTPSLVLPHPLMWERSFVMLPLREIYPQVDALNRG